MTVLYCGDTHGRFQQIFQACDRCNPSAVVLLGDMEPQLPLDVELSPFDFDGVLHPRPGTGGSSGHELFASLEVLEDVLRQVPHEEVVISSSWREHHSFEEMRQYFSKDLRDRIVGVTPLPPLDSVPEHLTNYPRHAECVAWLGRNRPAAMPWLAIDDTESEFDPVCAQLLLIDGWVGLDHESAAQLLQRLNEGCQ